jgi:hypothetical protein
LVLIGDTDAMRRVDQVVKIQLVMIRSPLGMGRVQPNTRRAKGSHKRLGKIGGRITARPDTDCARYVAELSTDFPVQSIHSRMTIGDQDDPLPVVTHQIIQVQVGYGTAHGGDIGLVGAVSCMDD